MRREQRLKARLLHIAKSAIWRFNFSTQPTNRRFGDPEGEQTAKFSTSLAWTYVPCCPQAYLLFNVTIASPPKPPPKPPSFIGEVPQVGYPRQVSLGISNEVRNYFRKLIGFILLLSVFGVGFKVLIFFRFRELLISVFS